MTNSHECMVFGALAHSPRFILVSTRIYMPLRHTSLYLYMYIYVCTHIAIYVYILYGRRRDKATPFFPTGIVLYISIYICTSRIENCWIDWRIVVFAASSELYRYWICSWCDVRARFSVLEFPKQIFSSLYCSLLVTFFLKSATGLFLLLDSMLYTDITSSMSFNQSLMLIHTITNNQSTINAWRIFHRKSQLTITSITN